MHVFTQSFGIPLRPYVRRLRVQRAANALASGHSVTEAAYIAGFADASHLSRTVRRTFGVTPRQLRAITTECRKEEQRASSIRPGSHGGTSAVVAAM